MILDVTRWLPEHPGGSSIIPAQALNLECSRFFEVPPTCWVCTACFRPLVEYLCTPKQHELYIDCCMCRRCTTSPGRAFCT